MWRKTPEISLSLFLFALVIRYHVISIWWLFCSFEVSRGFTRNLSLLSYTYTHKIAYSFIYILNSLRPTDGYMRQGIGSSLVKVMACHLFGVKLLLGWMLIGCLLVSPGTNFAEITIKIHTFLSKMQLKMSSVIWHPFWLSVKLFKTKNILRLAREVSIHHRSVAIVICFKI